MAINAIVHISVEIWGSLFCVLAMICMAFGKEDRFQKHNTLVKLLGCAAILGVCDALAWAYRGNETHIGYYMVRWSNFLVFILFFVYGFLAADYLIYCLTESEKKIHFLARPVWYRVLLVMSIVGIGMFVSNIFVPWLYDFDATNHYYRLSGFIVTQILGIIIAFICLGAVFRKAKQLSDEDTIACVCLGTMPILSFIIAIFYYGVSLTYIAIIAAVMVSFATYVINKAKVSDQRKYELRERETALMMSQVSPHFVYNSLAAIRSQVLDDPEAAYDTIGEFASFLRSNLNAKRLEEKVTLKNEIETTWVYINLEKLRLGDNLQVDTEIEDENILLPAMTLQPMIENAIRHGIKPKGKGHITISEEKENGFYVIRIKDDGIGFDTTNVNFDGKEHIGMHSVTERIKYMCHGNVEYKSTVDLGTEIKIYIPTDEK